MEIQSKQWQCKVCGYMHEGDMAPDLCPLCGVGPELFVAIEETKGRGRAWQCTVCNMIHEADMQPSQCSVCGALAESILPYYRKHVVIVGGGVAALSAAQMIRVSDQTIGITMISEEKQYPYYRINLSKYLSGEISKEALQINDEAWYQTHHITCLRDAKVKALHTENKQITLFDGKTWGYDQLILATGATCFIPPIEGREKGRVMAIRTLDDVDRALAITDQSTQCICIGGGLLGLEIAGAMAKRGQHVQVVEVAPWLMPRQLNQKASEHVKAHVEKLGITIDTGVKIACIEGNEICTGIRLADGRTREGQLILITAGIQPRLELAAQAGIEIGRGIIVNEYMETSMKDVFAVGDGTAFQSEVYGLWPIAKEQGEIAAQTIVGKATKFVKPTPSSFLKVLGIDVFSMGNWNDEGLITYEWEGNGQYYYFGMRGELLVSSIIIGDQSLAMKTKQWIEQKIVWEGQLPPDVYHLLAKVNR
ncbi:MAG: FAD-dependent oxidoreductase [Cellulosilyticaceae bacterium]